MTTRRRTALRQLAQEAQDIVNERTEDMAEQGGNQDGAIVFCMTPFGSVIDMSTESGRKLFHMAAAPLGDVLFDGKSHNVNSFLDKCKERAVMIQCEPIFRFNSHGENLSIFTNYTSSTVEEIKAQALVRYETDNWHKQASYCMGLSIMSSIDDTVRRTVVPFRDTFETNFYVDGPTLLRVILKCVYVDTSATVFNVRNNLASMTLNDFDNDILKLNRHVREQVATLQARGERAGTDIAHILLKAYKTSENETFIQRMDRISDTEIPDWNTLMQAAEQKYQELKDSKEWDTPSSKKLILALKAENKKLKKAVTDGKRRGHRAGRTHEKTGLDGKPSGLKPWLLGQPKGKQKTMLTYKGEKWYWCEHHEKWQKHSSTECKLNPKNKEKTKPNTKGDKKGTKKNVTVDANLAEETDRMDDDQDDDHDFTEDEMEE